jgi:nucleoside 2-deoxyribosyltransferase
MKRPKIKSIYIIGSLRNPKVVGFANALQAQGFEAFCDWLAAGRIADDSWRDYTKARGLNYKEALRGYAAQNVFQFDKRHLDRCDASVLLMPAGKSGHLELGYTIGQKKPGFVLFTDTPKRYDVMVNFATDVFFSQKELFKELRKYK